MLKTVKSTIYNSGGSKFNVKRSILPRGARIDQDCSGVLMNILAGIYAPLNSVSFKSMRLSAFGNNIIIGEHNVVMNCILVLNVE